jgi:lysophospholipase L1-like esterase
LLHPRAPGYRQLARALLPPLHQLLTAPAPAAQSQGKD